MAISMAIIVGLTVLIVLPTGMCTFNPGAPESGPVQEVDEKTFLQMESGAMPFDVYLPQAPEGWVPNSARRTMVGQQPAPVVGYVTSKDGYLQLTQTGVPLEDAVAAVDGYTRHQAGTEDVDGTTVSLYSSDDDHVRDVWAFQRGSTTMLISGASSEEDFRALVTAALQAEKL